MSKPSFSFGLKKNLTKHHAPTKSKPATFGDDDGSEDDSKGPGSGAPIREITELDGFDSATPCSEPDKRKGRTPKVVSQPPLSARKPTDAVPTRLGDLSSALDARRHAAAAEALDASIYDYDGVYDSLKRAGRKAKEAAAGGAEGAQQGPKYFGSIQRAAELRERDRLIAEEKRLKRERDAEGAEFADKEKFVTEAYKRQQAENRRLEEEEKRREEQEARNNKGKGMADFYKKLLTRDEEIHAEKMKATTEAKDTALSGNAPADEEASRTEADVAREINDKGGNVVVNDDGEVVDKRQLLKGGLNISARKKSEIQQQKTGRGATGATNNGTSKSKGVFTPGGKQAMRERQTRMLEAQLEETLKRSRQEGEESEKVDLVSKSRKTEADISSAKERYLARKRAAEEAKKNGLADGM